MRKEPDRQAVLAMQKAGCSIRKIARLMKMSRKTVRRILACKHQPGIERPSRYESLAPLVCNLFTRYEGNVVSFGQELKNEYGHDVPYPSLTRLVRQLQLRESANKRRGSFQYPPGKEAQHDTSPHRLTLGGKSVKAQCAAMAPASCRLLYAQYYPRFTRFEAKIFISQALDYFGGVPRNCIIDNTSVIVASGSGCDAVMAPEMEAFGGIYGMHFQAYEIGHSDRKAIIERNFRYIEKNFLPGRRFTDWQQVNRQVKNWCSQTANNKNKRALAMTPRQAYATEKPWLQPLPAFRPPIYQSLTRVVDLSGFDKAVERALQYGLYDLNRLENLILSFVAGNRGRFFIMLRICLMNYTRP